MARYQGRQNLATNMIKTKSWTLISFVILAVFLKAVSSSGQWSMWWTYGEDGISGPSFWGMPKEFRLCSKGKNQSPVNIIPEDLLFDPGLKHLQIKGNKVSGLIVNSGKHFGVYINSSTTEEVLFTLGPLSYTYKLYRILFHFGDEDSRGSEHTVQGKQFSAEIHFLAYNQDLYDNYSLAEISPRGIASIAVFTQIQTNASHAEMDKILANIDHVQYKGKTFPLEGLYVEDLIPNYTHYITYDGSMTYPGCHETVTWMILNRPIYVSSEQMQKLRTLRQVGPENPLAFLYNNFRPTMPLNRRTLRTNINFVKGCTMERNMHYKVQQPHATNKDAHKHYMDDTSSLWPEYTYN